MPELWELARLQLIKSLNFYKYFFYTSFVVSSYFKLNNLGLSEFKYDQMKALYVANKCSEGNYFHYAESSTSFPQGPLYYLFECAFGTIGVTDYLNLLRLQIIVSQIVIFISFLIFKKFVNENVLYLAITIYLLNPYLIVSSRNSSTHYHQEIFLLLFFYLLLSRNKNKKISFYLGVVTSLAFSAYYLLFVFMICMLFTFAIVKKLEHFNQIFFGGLFGFVINSFLYFPYIQSNGLTNIGFNNTSWGISSYWRILGNFLSGRSITNKVNGNNDYKSLTENYSSFEIFINFNSIIVLILFVISLFYLTRGRLVEDINLIGITIFVTYGVLLTLLDIALYPHYYFSMFIFGYVFLINQIQNIKYLVVIIFIFCISNILIFTNFNSYIADNGGALNSDFGKTFETCGCCVDDARICRGQ